MLLSYLVPAFLASAMVVAKLVPPGFVTTNGVQFELDGEPFAFVGSNSFWLPLLLTETDVRNTFGQMKSQGVKVVRTWAFNAINSSELHQTPVETGLTYYQVWEDNDWILNEGSQGFERLDTVLEIAAEFDMRLILTFTNNWVGYGGMELYIDHILPGASTHDIFYTDEEMIASYQRYVRTIVERYKDSATVFAWEMMNEARCLGDLPSGPDCSAQSRTIPNWYKLQSDYIRSLDPHHLITTGGEGHFNWDNSTLIDDYNFNGEAGEDFDYDLTFENVDFGTYHLYPQSWYPDGNFPLGGGAEGWGLFWIQAHANSAKKVGKPVVLEEFGVTPQSNRTLIYPSWVQLALDTKHGGIMPWQFGALGLTEDGGNRLLKYTDALVDGESPNDGYAVYKNETAVWNIFKCIFGLVGNAMLLINIAGMPLKYKTLRDSKDTMLRLGFGQ